MVLTWFIKNTIVGKKTKHVFSKDKNVSKKPLDIVHFDVWGPTKMTSIKEWRCYVIFINDHIRKMWVFNEVGVAHTHGDIGLGTWGLGFIHT